MTAPTSNYLDLLFKYAHLRAVLEEIAGSHCTNYTGPNAYNCLSNGRVAFAEYGSSAACVECIARYVLDQDSPAPPFLAGTA